jgi:hypothetical protein
MALGVSSAQAQDLVSGFATLSWADKVTTLRQAGAHYRRDCSDAMRSGACLHIMEYFNGPEFVELRARTDGAGYQWCLGSNRRGQMVCYDQVTGAPTTFVLLGNLWHSVN